MRAFGWPSASTVASVMAVGSRGSAAVASFSQAAKSRKGSSAAVKSPLVNQLGRSIGAVSDIRGALFLAGAVGSTWRTWRLYSGCGRSRLWRGSAAAAGLWLALSAGGCSLSYQLDSLVGGSDKTDNTNKTETTGSIAAPELPPDGDLNYARAAASEVLKRNEKNASQPWENPKSGARGTVTPIASAYTADGRTCRNFLASYVNGKAEAWLEGSA